MNLEIMKHLLVDIFTPLEPAGIKKRLLKYVTENAGDYLGVAGGRIWERKDGHYQLVDQVGNKEDKIGFRFPIEHPYINSILKSDYIMYRRNDDGRDQLLEDELGIGDFIAVPIGPDAQYLASFDITEDKGKSRAQRNFLSMVSLISQTALAEAERIKTIENEKGQVERELELAYTTQIGILPQSLPEFEGYDMYGVSKPIKSRNIGVGGDYYSVELIDEDNLEISIGDVAGKGIVAARLARDLHVAKHALRDVCISDSCSHKFEPSMIELMNRINSTLYKNVSHVHGTGRYMTYFYSKLNRNGRLNFVNAGHNRPLLLHDDNFDELSGGGIPLGSLDDFKYVSNSAEINPDDVLVLYTDGITEAENWQHEFFGTDRLKETIYDHRGESATQITQGVLESVKKHRNRAPKNDDRTLFVIKKVK